MANGGTYDEGETVRLGAIFKVGLVNTDPTTVTLRVKNPAGTITVSTYGGVAPLDVLKSATGIYYKDVLMNVEGTWWYRCEGTGTAAGAAEAFVKVKASRII